MYGTVNNSPGKMPGLNGPIPGLNMQLAEYLYDYHVGEFKAVSSRELEVTFQMHGAKIREQINALRTAGVPICSCDKGYFYAENAEELSRTIRQLRSRIKKIACAERGLARTLGEPVDPNQFTIPLSGGGVK